MTATEPSKPPNLLAWLLPLAGLILAAATIWLFHDCVVDDAYISLRYARNLLEAGALEYNPGERVEGYTNLGFVLACAVLARLTTLDLLLVARLLGLFGAALAVWCGPALVSPKAQEQALERAVARLLLLANFAFVYFAWTGMETGLATGLLCAAGCRFVRAGCRFELVTGLLSAAAFAVRPELLAVGGVLGIVALCSHGFVATLRATGAWLWVLAVAAIEAWRWAYYGALSPNTARVKGLLAAGSGGIPWYGTIGDDAQDCLMQSGGAVGLLLVMVALAGMRDRRRLAVTLGLGAAVVAFAVYAGGDWMLGYRYLQPALPLYLALLASGGVTVWRLCRAHWPRRLAVPAGLASLAVLAISLWSCGLQFRWERGQYPQFVMTSTDMERAARWLAAHYASDTQIMCGRIGALGFYSRLRVIDLFGLTDATIAAAGRQRARVEAYLRERRPELLLANGRPGVPPAPEWNEFGIPYEFVRAFPQGSEHTWLLYERRAGP